MRSNKNIYAPTLRLCVVIPECCVCVIRLFSCALRALEYGKDEGPRTVYSLYSYISDGQRRSANELI